MIRFSKDNSLKIFGFKVQDIESGYIDIEKLHQAGVETDTLPNYDNSSLKPINILEFLFQFGPEAAFKIGEKMDDPIKMYLSDVFTVTANLVGVPAISFPIGNVKEEGSTAGELPIGGQLMGKWFDEEGILNAAFSFEKSN